MLRFHRERAGAGIGRLGNCFVDAILIYLLIFVKRNLINMIIAGNKKTAGRNGGFSEVT